MTRRCLLAIFAAVLFVSVGRGVVAEDESEIWTVATIDPIGDTSAPGPDAAQLSYRYEAATSLLWFRIATYGAIDPSGFGVRIANERGGVVTARVTAGKVTNASPRTLIVRIDRDAVTVGVKRSEIATQPQMNVTAAVGTDREWTDEIPNMRSAAIDLSAPRPQRGLREIDVRRNNLRFPGNCHCLRDDELPSMARRGRTGGRPVILISGVFSGPATFDGFIARHASEYRFFVVTPPGLNGSRPRPMPSETVSYGDRPWTRHLERDVLDLIRRERLDRPVIVSHGFPGSLVATAIAADHSDMIAGAIEIAAMPPQPFPSPNDPTGKTLITPADRARYNDRYWAPHWFKYVTPETWESNNYRAAMFQKDADRAEQTRQQIERNPLSIKIRYLTESNATDDSDDIRRVAVPLLALRPGFSKSVFDDPANGWFKTSFVDAWDRFSTNAKIQVTTLPDAGVLVFDDQPTAADEAVVRFLEQVWK